MTPVELHVLHFIRPTTFTKYADSALRRDQSNLSPGICPRYRNYVQGGWYGGSSNLDKVLYWKSENTSVGSNFETSVFRVSAGSCISINDFFRFSSAFVGCGALMGRNGMLRGFSLVSVGSGDFWPSTQKRGVISLTCVSVCGIIAPKHLTERDCSYR